MTGAKFVQYLLSMLVMVSGGFFAGTDYTDIGIMLIIGGAVLIGLLAVDAIWTRWMQVLDTRGLLVDKRTKFVTAVSAADSETRQMTREEFPEIGIEFGVIPVFYILDDTANTGIVLPFFQKFLQDSNENGFVELRNYNEDKYLQNRFGVSRDTVRNQWELATKYLQKKHYLLPGSMSGNHSYRWASKAHYRKMISWFGTNASIPEMGAAQS